MALLKINMNNTLLATLAILIALMIAASLNSCAIYDDLYADYPYYVEYGEYVILPHGMRIGGIRHYNGGIRYYTIPMEKDYMPMEKHYKAGSITIIERR